MHIYHFTGTGKGVLFGKVEYIELQEEELTKDEVSEHTAPGFELDCVYDTDTMTDCGRLPTDRMLIPIDITE